MDITIEEHARFEIQRRGIEESDIISVINQPQQIIPSKKGRIILQSKYYDRRERKEMLLRVIGKENPERFILITAYKTSKIEKYWREEMIR
ncbi:MAG: DUF4258 domain-containing protein [Deltaproteobacteria bacterium]|nr:DUF4258 domain-containing protein [Deltaproteobacteria bacterium]